MFDYTNVGAFILSIAIFGCLFTTYPLLNKFLKSMIYNLFWSKEEVSPKVEFIFNILFTAIPLMFALFYNNIGTILSYVGAITGFALIYVFPVAVHLKRMRLSIETPLLAEAIDLNEYEVEKSTDRSPQIAIKDRFLAR